MLEENTTLTKHLRCKECLSKELGFGDMSCKKHGYDYIDYKCRFCCNIALYACYNGTHFCYDCHAQACARTLKFHRDLKTIKCSGKRGKCPLGIDDHVMAWKNPRFALGCALCRSEKLHLWLGEESQVHQYNYRKLLKTQQLNIAASGEFNPRAMRVN